MNYKSIFIVLLAISISSFSQTKGKQFSLYSTLGLKGTYGTSSVKNSNMSSDKNLDFKSGAYKSYGFKTSLTYIGKSPKNTLLGVHADYLFGSYPIKFNEIKTSSNNYSKTVDLKTTNIVLVFRYTNASGRWFVEAGQQFSSFSSVSQTNSDTDSLFTVLATPDSYKNSYQNYTSLVFGAGIYYKGFVISLRYTSSSTSIMGEGSNPTMDGYYNNSFVNTSYDQQYSAFTKTKHGTIQFTIEYYIPFITFGRSSCGGAGVSLFRGVDSGYYWGRKDNYYN